MADVPDRQKVANLEALRTAGESISTVHLSNHLQAGDAPEPRVNLAAWRECTEVEGPGRRFALWTQGCLIRCQNCCNPELFPFVPKHLMPVRELLEQIERASRQFDLEGISFLGGEPTHQAPGLSIVAQHCQAMGLSVMLFTGYTMEQLQAVQLPGVAELLQYCDIVVDGPYKCDLPDYERNWVGSTNQRFHFLTNRYQPGIEYDGRYRPAVEFRVYNSGDIIFNGSPIRNMLRTYTR
ncbi:MAG: anaerobic ribonucleoside-triphosphate reductase-activating protein [Pirellulaceae bacterium]|nr:MAG: anaerobic ribonucleoside-triphosphate reductase-activating protein [Pirellulaceae bacterium]